MVCLETEKRLADTIHSNLFNLIRKEALPISPGIAVMAFKEGLDSIGGNLEFDDVGKTVEVNINNYLIETEEMFSLNTRVTYAQIIDGDSTRTRSSVHCIHQAIRRMIDLMEQDSLQAKEDIHSSKRRERFRGILNKAIKSSEDYVREVLYQREEDLLLDSSFREESSIKGDRLLDLVVGTYGLDKYEESLEHYQERSIRSPQTLRIERMVSQPWEQIRRIDLPTPEEFEKFFYGDYLFELAQDKGYRLNDHPFNQLRMDLMIRGNSAFDLSRDMVWGEK